MVDHPRELYGAGNLSRHLTEIITARYDSGGLSLPGAQGTIARDPPLRVTFQPPAGYGNALAIEHMGSVRLVQEVSTPEGMAVADDRTVPALNGLAIIVTYDGRTPVALELVRTLAGDVAKTYADDARAVVDDAATRAGRAVRRGAVSLLRNLADIAAEGPKK